MSIINRMLQDIDRRGTLAGIDALGANPDIRSIAMQGSRSIWTRLSPLIAALLLGACIILAMATIFGRERGAGFFFKEAPRFSGDAQLPSPVASVETIKTAPLPNVVETGGSQSVPISAPAIVELDLAEKTSASLPPLQRKPDLPPSDRLRLSLQLSALVAETQPAASTVANTPIAKTLQSAPGFSTITNVPIRQVAADETVITARALWNDGSRAVALATLREALAAAEAARDSRAAVTLAQELARLEVAGNRAQVALDVLKRLEKLAAEDAHVWALRGNAEQRLGAHADAAKSYLMALRLKPNEGKWMLGAAISLAAIGKLDEAQIWVDRARAREAVTPAIEVYLRQLGLVVRQ